jgi:hypothetical protein
VSLRMPKKSRAGRGSYAKKTKSKAALQDQRELYKRGVLIRGEAGKRGKDGKLPPGVTHEIVDGEVVRVRYSMF